MQITGWMLPICLLGYVRGPVRWETCKGADFYFGESQTFVYQKPIFDVAALTHLQKRSKFGFLLMWPLCFHFWYTFRFQEQDESGTWLPGTEKVLYGRIGARWEAGNCCYQFPSLFLGGHWD